MAKYIKEVDPNHLLMEAGGADRKAMLADPNVDIMSDHLYEYWNKKAGQPWELAPIARKLREECKGKKPLIIDEFGLGSTENIRLLMETIREEGIAGGLMWSIRGHRRDGGWYYHNEGGTPVNSFHIPGFSVGYSYEETRLLDLLRNEAFLIRGIEPLPIEKPTPAPILYVQGDGFTWRGSTGAAFYSIERAEKTIGPWKVLSTGIDDSVIADVVNFENTPRASEPLELFYDETTKSGKKYFYRITGENVAGATDYSNVLEVQR
jgi:hypothetical protein